MKYVFACAVLACGCAVETSDDERVGTVATAYDYSMCTQETCEEVTVHGSHATSGPAFFGGGGASGSGADGSGGDGSGGGSFAPPEVTCVSQGICPDPEYMKRECLQTINSRAKWLDFCRTLKGIYGASKMAVCMTAYLLGAAERRGLCFRMFGFSE